jgi:hypothetical protein
MHTLFIVGAGASYDYGLPVGSTLADSIRLKATALASGFDPAEFGQVAEYLIQRYPNAPDRAPKMDALKKIAERIYPAASIDRFIEQNNHDISVTEMGKVLISSCISEAEASGSLSLDHGDRVDLASRSIAASWCDAFLKFLVRGQHWTSVDDMLGQDYSVVCFNYDRCLERYLISGLQQAFGYKYPGAWDLVYNKLTILHPYGQLGRLPSQSPNGEDGIPYGSRVTDPWLMAQNIRTFTEQSNDRKLDAEIHKAIDMADRVVFLGFSFEQLNMEMMKIYPSKRRRVFASAFGIEPSQESELAGRIRDMLGVAPNDREHTPVKFAFGKSCKQTLDDYYYELTSYLA